MTITLDLEVLSEDRLALARILERHQPEDPADLGCVCPAGACCEVVVVARRLEEVTAGLREVGRYVRSEAQRLRQYALQDHAARLAWVADLARSITNELPRPAAGPDRPKQPHLTPRGVDVLNGLADGLGYREIAERLTISRNTVRNLLTTAYRTLGARNGAHAVTIWLDEGKDWSTCAR